MVFIFEDHQTSLDHEGYASYTLSPNFYLQSLFDFLGLHKSSHSSPKTLIVWWTLIGNLTYSSGHQWTSTLVHWSYMACTSHHLLCALTLLFRNPNIQLLAIHQPCETTSRHLMHQTLVCINLAFEEHLGPRNPNLCPHLLICLSLIDHLIIH